MTDRRGNTGKFTYAKNQKAGRWVICRIGLGLISQVGTVQRSLRYTYNSHGHLRNVLRDLSGTEETISKYTYGTDALWQAATLVMEENLAELPTKQTIYLSQDYRTSSKKLVNQFANQLVGAADGAGYKYLAVFRDASTVGRFRVLDGGRLSEWNRGVSLQFF